MKVAFFVAIFSFSDHSFGKSHVAKKIYAIDSNLYVGCLVSPHYIDNNIKEKDCIHFMSEMSKDPPKSQTHQQRIKPKLKS